MKGNSRIRLVSSFSVVYFQSLDCKSDSRSCYIIDHNAYVVLSLNRADVGRSLASVRPDALQRLLEVGLYREIQITDNQAVIVNTKWAPRGGGGASITEMVRRVRLFWIREFFEVSFNFNFANFNPKTFPIFQPWSFAVRALSWIWSHVAWSLLQQLGIASDLHAAPTSDEFDNSGSQLSWTVLF